MEAKSNKEYLEQIRQTRVLGCASFGKICQQEIAELAFRLEAAEKQIAELEQREKFSGISIEYIEAKESEIARLRWLLGNLFYAWKHEQRIDAETWDAIEQIVKEERGEK